ncbi:MAG: YigZ family protein [Clostridia bacterium]|nr:YigZ family protein [Clostridia bacterium]MBR2986106.1 YigZ family protein [Clostridia bacterium]
MKEYTTIQGDNTVEIVIEKSRFIATAIHVDSVEEAQEFIASKRKKYFDATHNCYGYLIGDKAKFSDDGEPQGTAGMPIYECIKNSKIDHVCVVVTRYFGGIKLGAGGLVRAYSGSCAEALKTATKVYMTDCTIAEVVVDYSLLKGLRKVLFGKVMEKDVVWEDKVRLVLLFPTVSFDTISHIVTENTLGKCVLTKKEQLLCHYEQK